MLLLLRLLLGKESAVRIRDGRVVATSGRARASLLDDLGDAARIHCIRHALVFYTKRGPRVASFIIGGDGGSRQALRNVLGF